MSSSGPAQQVLCIRHAETAWSVSGRHTGRSDIPLTDHGREMARRLADEVAHWDLAAVLTSPLGRARETCDLAGCGDRAQARDELLEWDYGAYEGRTTADIRRERPTWDLWHDGAPEGEQASDVSARVDHLIAEVRAMEGNVALVAHGHVLRVLGARWVSLPAYEGARLGLSTGALSVLGYERETPVLWRWNDDRAASAR